MSRLGRDYLQVGYYTDSYFPDHSIRFIAINDCVDSDDGENELAPFRNVMNEMYARDISRKVRSSHRLRGNAGEPLAQPPYGYKKSPENKKRWIIDPEAAAVVRDIFAMAMEGKGNETIAGILQARKVLIPMAYWREKGLPRGGKVSQPDPYKWCKSTVEKILRQQEYCGDIVNFKTYSKSFKNKARIRRKTGPCSRMSMSPSSSGRSGSRCSSVSERQNADRQSQKTAQSICWQIISTVQIAAASCGMPGLYHDSVDCIKKQFVQSIFFQ